MTRRVEPFREVFDVSEEANEHWGMNDGVNKIILEDEVLAGNILSDLLGVEDFWTEVFDVRCNEDGELSKECFEEMIQLIIMQWISRNKIAEIVSLIASETLRQYGSTIPSDEIQMLTESIRNSIKQSLSVFTDSCFRAFDVSRNG